MANFSMACLTAPYTKFGLECSGSIYACNNLYHIMVVTSNHANQRSNENSLFFLPPSPRTGFCEASLSLSLSNITSNLARLLSYLHLTNLPFFPSLSFFPATCRLTHPPHHFPSLFFLFSTHPTLYTTPYQTQCTLESSSVE